MGAVSFAKDIKPMFRGIDIQHMAKPANGGYLLDDYKFMSDPSNGYGHAQNVEDRLKDGSMPPDNPWTQSQIDLYVKWRSDGYQP